MDMIDLIDQKKMNSVMKYPIVMNLIDKLGRFG